MSAPRPPALDLSGFTAVAPPGPTAPAQATPGPTAPGPTAPAPTAPGPSTPGRAAPSRLRSVASPAATPAAPAPAAPTAGAVKRVSLNVPAELVEAARVRAETHGVYLADVVVDALTTAADTVVAAMRSRPVARRAGRPRRQRDVHHPTQLVVALTPEERSQLDGGAERCGLTRSAFATAVLRAALGTDA